MALHSSKGIKDSINSWAIIFFFFFFRAQKNKNENIPLLSHTLHKRFLNSHWKELLEKNDFFFSWKSYKLVSSKVGNNEDRHCLCCFHVGLLCYYWTRNAKDLYKTKNQMSRHGLPETSFYTTDLTVSTAHAEWGLHQARETWRIQNQKIFAFYNISGFLFWGWGG